jgi:hypothetical protein
MKTISSNFIWIFKTTLVRTSLLLFLLVPLGHYAAYGQNLESDYRLLRYNSGCGTGPGCISVIFIHGIHGSAETDMNFGTSDGLITSEDNNWNPLLKYLKQQYPTLWSKMQPYIFRYLSDKNDSTIVMGKALSQLVAGKGVPAPRILVAHSMGGIVARTFMNHRLSSSSMEYDSVIAAITLASPHHGTILANLDWRNWVVDKRQVDIRDVFLLDLCNKYDWVYWGVRNSSWHLWNNSSLPNRNDLVWDNYDGFLDTAQIAHPEKTWELNSLLKALAQSEQARKLIVYAGNLSDDRMHTLLSSDMLEKLNQMADHRETAPHAFLEVTAALMRDKIGILIGNDGFVSQDSAVLIRNPYVAGRRYFTDYDHQDMLGNPDGDAEPNIAKNAKLFDSIAMDLTAILAFDGVAPRLGTMSFPSSSAVGGSTVLLTYPLKNINGNTTHLSLNARIIQHDGTVAACTSMIVPVPEQPGNQPKTGDQRLTRDLVIPSNLQQSTVTVRAEVWPASVANPCGFNAPLLESLGQDITLEVLPPPAYTTHPSIALALATSQSDFRIGDAIRLTYKTTAGVATTTAAQSYPLYTFLWKDGPDGQKFFTLKEGFTHGWDSVPVPVYEPMALIDNQTEMPSTIVTPDVQTGTYTSHAGISLSEKFSSQNMLVQSNAITYRILAGRSNVPSVISVSTALARYKAGDTMTIKYSTVAGSVSKTYDLMLQLTSQATGNIYYFYDDSSDYNRWIHTSARPMWTGDPSDGDYEIPSGTMPPIVIENDTPSGTYAMLAYFSESGKNQQVGNASASSFILETPAPEGGCFIATAAYGSALSPSVSTLRSFRDKYLLRAAWSKWFVQFYYRVGPRYAAVIAGHTALRKMARIALWPMAGFAAVALSTNMPTAWGVASLLLIGTILIFRKAPRMVKIAFLLVLFAGAASAADLKGIVVRSTPFPVPIASVKLDLDPIGESTRTAPDGSFRFQNLSPGQYTLKASLPGYLSSTTDLSVTSSSGQPITVKLVPVGSRSYVYYMAHTAETDGWWTFFSLVNPNSTAAEVVMEAFASDGAYLGASTEISELKINQQAFGAPSDFFAADIILRAAWYRFTSISPLTGFEMFGHTSGAIAAVPLTTAESNELYLPHIAEDSIWWTGLTAVSAAVKSNPFHLELWNYEGNVITESDSMTMLRPGQKTVAMVSQYFGSDYPLDVSWAKLRSDGPITGFEAFATKDVLTMSAVPALTRGYRQFWFPHVATTKGWWTGFSLLNISARQGIVKMSAYDTNGKKVAVSNDIPLNPGQKAVGLPENYFTSFPAGVAYLEITSDTEITGFELVGLSTHALLGGLPALAQVGTQLALPFAISTTDWDTEFNIINTSISSSKVTVIAMSYNGDALVDRTYSVPGKGSMSGSLKKLFGYIPTDATWLKAVSDGSSLLGFLKLYSVGSGQFSDIAAEPLVGPEALSTVDTEGKAGVLGTKAAASKKK